MTYAFSDTYIITINRQNLEILFELQFMLSLLFYHGLGDGICLRGTFSYGTFYSNRDKRSPIIIGPAVDEAAEWYEKGDWFGVHASPTANFLLDKYNHDTPLDFFFTKYPIPMKESINYNAWAINWPYFMTESSLREIKRGEKYIRKKVLSQLKQKKQWVYEKFSRIPTGSKDISKLTNTLTFYDELCNKLES